MKWVVEWIKKGEKNKKMKKKGKVQTVNMKKKRNY